MTWLLTMDYSFKLPPWFTICLLASLLTHCTSRPSADCNASFTCSAPTRPQAGGAAGYDQSNGAAAAGTSLGTSAGTSPGTAAPAGGTAGVSAVAGAAGRISHGSISKVSVSSVIRISSLGQQVVDVSVVRNNNNDELGIVVDPKKNSPSGIAIPDSTIAPGISKGQITFQVTSAGVVGGPFTYAIRVSSKVDPTVTAEAPIKLYVTRDPGVLDSSLAGTGIVTTKVTDRTMDVVRHAVVDGSGRTLLVGCGKATGMLDLGWATRLLPNGSLDATFGAEGRLLNFGNPPSCAHRALQTEEALYIWAKATVPGTGSTTSFIRKLGGSGESLKDFGDTNSGDTAITTVADPNDLIALDQRLFVLAGSVGLPFVLGSHGAIDSTFHAPETIAASAIALDSSGRLLYGESRSDAYVIGRLSPNGAVDSTFGAEGVAKVTPGATSGRFVSLAAAPNGSIFGLVQAPGATDGTNAVLVVALRSGGAIEINFGVNGRLDVPNSATPATAYGAAVQLGGKLLVLYAELDTTHRQSLYRLARYDYAGTLDSTFLSNGILDLSVSAPGVDFRGIAYDPFGNLAVLYGDSPTGVVVLRVWL